jgi:hypothetical protein
VLRGKLRLCGFFGRTALRRDTLNLRSTKNLFYYARQDSNL